MNDQEFQRHHQPKPCQFCANGASYAPLDEMEKHGVKVYFCYECRAEYLYFSDGLAASVSLYTEINQRMYRWTVTSQNVAQLIYIKNPGIPGTRKNENLEFIKSFQKDFPQVTPQNINEKLRTWLVFL